MSGGLHDRTDASFLFIRAHEEDTQVANDVLSTIEHIAKQLDVVMKC